MKTSEAIWHVLNNIPGYTTSKNSYHTETINVDSYPYIDQQVVLAKHGKEATSKIHVATEAANLAAYIGFPEWSSEEFKPPGYNSALSLRSFMDLDTEDMERVNKANEIIAHWETAAYYCESIGD